MSRQGADLSVKPQKPVCLKYTNSSVAVDGFYQKNLTYPASHVPWEQEQHTKPGKQFLLQTLRAQLGPWAGLSWQWLKPSSFLTLLLHEELLVPGTRQWHKALDCCHSWPARAGRGNPTAQPLTPTNTNWSPTRMPCKNPVQKSLWTAKSGDSKSQLKDGRREKHTWTAQWSPGLPRQQHPLPWDTCTAPRQGWARSTQHWDHCCALTVLAALLQGRFHPPLPEQKDLDLKGERL